MTLEPLLRFRDLRFLKWSSQLRDNANADQTVIHSIIKSNKQ